MKYLNKIFLFIIYSNTYSQCINLKGIVYSQNNNQALEAKIEVRVNGQKKNIGKTNIDGKFEIEIPCDAQSLILTKKDFRNLEIPIKTEIFQGLFYVKIPLIPLDKEISDKPYAQSEQSDIVLNNVASINTKTAPRIFKIVDATTKQSLTGKVCLFYTKSGEKKCLDTDKSNNPKVVFQEEDIVAIEADSKGFQSYIGNIVVNKLDNQVSVYEIALSKTPIIFVAEIHEIETNTIQNIDLLSPDLKKIKIEQFQNQLYSFLEKTGQYSYKIKTKNQLIENKVIIDFGINFFKSLNCQSSNLRPHSQHQLPIQLHKKPYHIMTLNTFILTKVIIFLLNLPNKNWILFQWF